MSRQKIEDLVGQIVLPKVIFTVKPEQSDGDYISFESNAGFDPLPETCELNKLVNNAANNCVRYLRVDNRLVLELDSKEIVDKVCRSIVEFHIKLWMKVNEKTNWRRTKLSKDIGYAHSDKFKDTLIELFLDAEKYGITVEKHMTLEIKPIHKFIAIKFQTMVEAECPR